MFCKENFLQELKVDDGESITVTVKTLNRDCKHSSFDDLGVANTERKHVDWITLPRMFSQEDLPVA